MKCECDFCTGKKRWTDNWCPRCGEVQMLPPKSWEDMDVCDACDEHMRKENEADADDMIADVYRGEREVDDALDEMVRREDARILSAGVKHGDVP